MHTHVSAVAVGIVTLEVALGFTLLKLAAIQLAKQPGMTGSLGKALGWQIG